MKHLSTEMQQCVQNCQSCHATCLSMALTHCLEMGGQHVEPNHFRLMVACAEICQTSANMMLIGTDLHKLTCGVCAQICEQCADNCERVGDMEECVQACRTCAASCQAMSQMAA